MNHLLSDDLNCLLLINGEMIKGNGEDACYATANEKYAVLAVMDGCGGIGSRKYPVFRSHTGAYMSSRAVSGAFYSLFHNRSSFPEDFRSAVSDCIQDGFETLKENSGPVSRISGSMVKTFPTTLAAGAVRPYGKKWRIEAVWSGDSRVYLLDREGLAQISQDSTSETDAFEALYSDPPLENLLSADQAPVLSSITVFPKNPFLLICATDGCFGYLPSPMHFELLIEEVFLESRSLNDFGKRMKDVFRELSSDDYTMLIAGFGFSNYQTLRSALEKRKTELGSSLLKDGDRKSWKKIWNEKYRETYERFWRRNNQ